MKKLSFFGVFTLGLAIFTMFFGAGNIVFPLILGRETGDKIPIAMLGFILSAVIVPILGVIATISYEGDYKKLVYSIGKIPGVLLIAACMLIIGPLGAAPRCIVISHSAISWHFPGLSLLIYSIFVGLFIFLLAYKESAVVDILGKILGPIKIILLTSIIILGLFSIKHLAPTPITQVSSFFSGFEKGYFTIDLLGGFFFANLIYMAIKRKEITDPKEMVHHGVLAGIIGGILLGLIYIGFGFVAAMYGPEVESVPPEQLLSAIAVKILGPNAGILANITVAVTCITTALALTTVFAEYLHRFVFRHKVSYSKTLLLAIVITVFMSNLGFAGIMKIIVPVALAIYPATIVLCLAGIAKQFWGFKYIKTTFFATLAITLFFQFII